jgi:hypothetical protein
VVLVHRAVSVVVPEYAAVIYLANHMIDVGEVELDHRTLFILPDLDSKLPPPFAGGNRCVSSMNLVFADMNYYIMAVGH